MTNLVKDLMTLSCAPTLRREIPVALVLAALVVVLQLAVDGAVRTPVTAVVVAYATLRLVAAARRERQVEVAR